MEEDIGSANMLSGSIIQNIKSNWLDLVIIVGVLIIIIIIVSIARRRLSRLLERKIPDDKILIRKRSLTFNSVASNLIVIVAFIAAALIIADQLGINVTPLLAGAGVVGMIIGFGAQSLVRDLINGLFILFEQWYQVGDVITVGEITGTVERFNLRTTIIRDIEGTVHYIPNGEIKTLGNRTQLWARAVVEVGVHYNEDTDRVVEILEEIFDEIMMDKKYKKVILERPSILGDGGISDLGDSAVVFKLICKVRAGDQWTIARQLRRRVKEKFDKVGIEIPYPCTNIYMRNEK
ncbi:MAG TPA: mechanosensitive ion channel family protein [Actinobacteria bacterium]|nr:mechanosensitive ion channel family protein [Actinomycetota bacterium]